MKGDASGRILLGVSISSTTTTTVVFIMLYTALRCARVQKAIAVLYS